MIFQIDEITKVYGDYREVESENISSKIYDNDFFGYKKVTVIQPELDENNEPKRDKKGNFIINKDLTDTEIIPLQEDNKKYMEREVIPFVPYAQIDESKTKIGYEISFTKYFYKYQEPRKTDEIMKEILEIDKELEGILKELSNE